MRRAARTDANHGAIVAALRQAGATVISLAAVGDGCPDLLVGYRGRTELLEVKDGSKPPSRRALTPQQQTMLTAWAGARIRVALDPQQALDAIIGATDAKEP